MREHLAYIISKTIIVQIYGNYPKFATPDNEMIARMLHLPPDKNRLHNKKSAQLVKEHTAENKIDNRSIYYILDQIRKDTDLYLHVKQHESKRDIKGAFFAIHCRWLGQNMSM